MTIEVAAYLQFNEDNFKSKVTICLATATNILEQNLDNHVPCEHCVLVWSRDALVFSFVLQLRVGPFGK